MKKLLFTIICLLTLTIGVAQKKSEYNYIQKYDKDNLLEKEIEVPIVIKVTNSIMTVKLRKKWSDGEKGQLIMKYNYISKTRITTMSGFKSTVYVLFDENTDLEVHYQVFDDKEYGARILFWDGSKLELYKD